MYETGLSLQTAQRELANLLCLGILKRRETKARTYYQIDMTSPWFIALMCRPACRQAGSSLSGEITLFLQIDL